MLGTLRNRDNMQLVTIEKLNQEITAIMSDRDERQKPNNNNSNNNPDNNDTNPNSDTIRNGKKSSSWLARLLSAILTRKLPQKKLQADTSEKSDTDRTPKKEGTATSPERSSKKQQNHQENPDQNDPPLLGTPCTQSPPVPSNELRSMIKKQHFNVQHDEVPILRVPEIGMPLRKIHEDERSSNEMSPRVDPSSAEDSSMKNVPSIIKSDSKNNSASNMIIVNADDEIQGDKIMQKEDMNNFDLSGIKLRDLFELEVVDNVSTESACKPKCEYSKITFSRTQTVYILPNTRQRVHKKIIRSRHDAWRRYGALRTIHELGGWTYTMQNKAKTFTKIIKGTPLPPAPNQPPILTEEEFYKRPIVTVQNNTQPRTKKSKKKKQADSDTSVTESDPPSC